MTACTCHVGPGKFEGESAAVFMAWNGPYANGFAEDTGAVLFVEPFEPDEAEQKAATEYGYCEPCIAAACLELATCLAVALEESDTGFVTGRLYEHTQAAELGELRDRIEREAGYPEDCDR